MPNPPWRNPARDRVPFKPPTTPPPAIKPEPAPPPDDPRSREIEPMYGTENRFDRPMLNAFLSGLEQAQVKITYGDLFRSVFEVPRGVKSLGVNATQGGIDLVKKAVKPELWHLVVHAEAPIDVGEPTSAKKAKYDPSINVDENLAAATRDWPVLPEHMIQITDRVFNPDSGKWEVQSLDRESKMPLTGVKVAERFLRQTEQLSGTGELPSVRSIISDIKTTAAQTKADTEAELAAKAFDEPKASPRRFTPTHKPTDPRSPHYTPPMFGLDPRDKSLAPSPEEIEQEEEPVEDPGQGHLADVGWNRYLQSGGGDDVDPAFFKSAGGLHTGKSEVAAHSGRDYEDINPEIPDTARIEYFVSLPARIAALKSEYEEKATTLGQKEEEGEQILSGEREELEILRSQIQNLQSDLADTANFHKLKGRAGWDLGFEAMRDFVTNRINIEDPEAQLAASQGPGGLAKWYGAQRGRMIAAAKRLKALVVISKQFEIDSITKGIHAGLIRTMSKYEGADRDDIFHDMERFLDKLITGKTWHKSSFDPSEDYINQLTRAERTSLSNQLASEEYREVSEEQVQKLAFQILQRRPI